MADNEEQNQGDQFDDQYDDYEENGDDSIGNGEDYKDNGDNGHHGHVSSSRSHQIKLRCDTQCVRSSAAV